MPRAQVFDVFPFFNELDVLEIRLHEMGPLVDHFVIQECGETFAGRRKPYYLLPALQEKRFDEFRSRICLEQVSTIKPDCVNRETGRLRERNQRNMMLDQLHEVKPEPNDIIIFSDCDEIPRRASIEVAMYRSFRFKTFGIHRLKQRSYYYNVNTLVDYGHDWASRARVGRYVDLLECGSMYDFRMHRKGDADCPVIEQGGWHFGYFGGVESIKEKVAAMSPFLTEYKLFGDAQLDKDIADRKDLHHRKCELPETFSAERGDDPMLPQYFLEHRDKFAHFSRREPCLDSVASQ